MKHKEGHFKVVRDSQLYFQAWLPDDEIKAGIIIVHGLGEHSGRYNNVVNHLVPQGYALYGFDQIGHGKSEGEREFVKGFEDYTDSLTVYLAMIREWLLEKPVFLLGHSMGGLIATYYLLDHADAFRGAIISAPLITVPDNINQGTVIATKILSKLAPKMGMMQLDANHISRDSEVVQEYKNDPLVFHRKTPVRVMAEMLKAMIRVDEDMVQISTPIVLVQGGADKLVDPIGAKTLYERVNSKDKTLKLYDGLYHEIFNEPERAQVLQDVANWLDAHI
ncbi:MAG: alpha/beta hydrolase [Chloroflexota bacterium]|nr:alpha/beta hydrolase [Chloroflexota bacterium]